MHIVEVLPDEKILLIMFSSLTKEDENIVFIDILKREIKSINSTKYSAIINAQELESASEDSLKFMKQLVDIISSTPFRGCYYIMPRRTTATSLIQKSHVKEEPAKI
jgi:hypothetical protein